MVGLRIEGGRHGGDRHRQHRHQPQHQAIEAGNTEIGEPAAPFRNLKHPLRPAELDQRQPEENDEEDGETEHAVALAEKSVHGSIIDAPSAT